MSGENMIVVELEVGTGAFRSQRSQTPLDWRDSKPSLKEGVCHIWETGLYTDVSLKVGPTGYTFNAHKVILMVRSEVFARLFKEPLASSKGDYNEGARRMVNIPDTSESSFRHFLKFLYTDNFSEDLTAEDTLDVLDLAHVYQVPGLISKCSEFIQSMVNVYSCIEIYQRTRCFSELDLSSQAFDFLKRNILSVVSIDQFLHLDVAGFKRLLECDNIAIDELCLFKALLRWGKVGGFVKDPNGEDKLRKDAIGLLTPHIRYLLIGPEDFATEVVPSKVLSSEEIIEVLCFFNTYGGKKRTGRLDIWSRPRKLGVFKDEKLKFDRKDWSTSECSHCNWLICKGDPCVIKGNTAADIAESIEELSQDDFNNKPDLTSEEIEFLYNEMLKQRNKTLKNFGLHYLSKVRLFKREQEEAGGIVSDDSLVSRCIEERGLGQESKSKPLAEVKQTNSEIISVQSSSSLADSLGSIYRPRRDGPFRRFFRKILRTKRF